MNNIMRNADFDHRVSIEKYNAIDENKLPVKTRFSGCFFFYKPLTKYSILQVLFKDILYNVFNIIQASFNSSPEADSI